MKQGRIAAQAAVLVAVIVAAYAPAFHAGFLWDDDVLLTGNPLIKAADGLWRFWSTTQAADYWPVTSTSFWLEWRLWGAAAQGYHATNIALHVIDSLLLWAVLAKLRIRGAWIAALLFAVHPLNVESVAWIAQRKNLLALGFFLASALGFAASEGWYAASLVAFVLSLLSKGSTLPLPWVLLGMVLWHRRPTARDGRRLIPYFLVAALFTVVNLWFQQHGPLHAVRPLSPGLRLLAAPSIAGLYLLKAVWPVGLTFIYPAWVVSAIDLRWWLVAAGLVGATAVLWRARQSWSRPYLAAWGYFLVMLLPVLGFVDVYFMKYAPVADHYAELALIGPVALAGWGAARVWDRAAPAFRPVAVAALAAWVVLLGAVTARQATLYRDNGALMRATLARNPGSWIAHYLLGMSAAQAGNAPEAIAEYREAVALEPGSAEAHNNLGDALVAVRRGGEAREQFAAAIRIRPSYAEAHNNLGNELKAEGRTADAIAEEEEALRIRPAYAAAHNNLGAALEAEGRSARAAAEYEKAVEFDGTLVEAHVNLAQILMRTPGREVEAVSHYRAALAARPNDAILHNNLGALLESIPGREQEALGEYQTAVRLRPNYADAQFNLSSFLARHPIGPTVQP